MSAISFDLRLTQHCGVLVLVFGFVFHWASSTLFHVLLYVHLIVCTQSLNAVKIALRWRCLVNASTRGRAAQAHAAAVSELQSSLSAAQQKVVLLQQAALEVSAQSDQHAVDTAAVAAADAAAAEAAAALAQCKADMTAEHVRVCHTCAGVSVLPLLDCLVSVAYVHFCV